MNTVRHPCFLYARKSTDVEDMQVLSIESQLSELREYAAREEIPIVEEMVEKQSAKTPGRPVFNDMLRRIEHGEAGGIVSWHPDRLARNSIDGGRLIYLVDTGKISVLKFPQFWFDPTPQGKFMLTIAFGQSKYFVDSLSENTKRGLRQKVRRGEFPSKAPVGYINDPRTKTIVVDRRIAPIVREAFRLFATGTYRIKDIADFLAAKGLVGRNGSTWKQYYVSKRILTNPFYYGHFIYNGEIHEGTHEPLIPKQLFDAVQYEWRKRSHAWHEKRPVKPYTGIFHCGSCGMMITAELKKKFYPTTNHHATYTYYRCTKKSKTVSCREPFIREEELDRQLSALLQTVALPQAWADRMYDRLDREEADAAHACRAVVSDSRREISTITAKLQRLLDSYLDQDIERSDYLDRKAKLLSEKKTLEESVSRLNHSRTAWLGPMRSWVKEASEIPKVARGEDKEAKKVLAAKIFGSDLTLSGRTARGSAKKPWAALCAPPTSRKMEPPVRIGLTSTVYDTAALPLS